MRLPQCYSFAEHELVTSVLDLLIGSPLPRSNDLSRPIVDIVLTEKPSSRQQSQLLAAWFGNQVSRLADRGNEPRHSSATMLTCFPPVSLVCWMRISSHAVSVSKAQGRSSRNWPRA